MKQFIILNALLLSVLIINASTGDSIIVRTHDKVLIQTNPSIGHTEYPAWAVFPNNTIKYNKVIMKLRFECPNVPNLSCGEWDYLNWIYLKRQGTSNSNSKDISLATFITPYGLFNPDDWSHEWVIDVTDYSLLLRDSVEIEYRHTGYEAQNDRGWKVSLDFIIIEGEPSRDVFKIENVYNGSYTYGNSADPISNFLTQKDFTTDSSTTMLRFRITQTGHGNDNSGGCGEFCSKKRSIYFNAELKDERAIWRDDCASNNVYAQFGTWPINRAAWCPASFAYPNNYDFEVTPNSNNNINVFMEDYVSSGGANYMFTSQMIHYSNNKFNNDVAVEDIIAPNNFADHLRANPICANPIIKIKNKGKSNLNSCIIEYGMSGSTLYNYMWNGNLKTEEAAIVSLPNLFLENNSNNSNIFNVRVFYPNSNDDENVVDNVAAVPTTLPSTLDSTFVILTKTNLDPQETTWKITNHNDSIIAQNDIANYQPNTIYRDTLQLAKGCYELYIEDSGEDGLDFDWFNNRGVGYVRINKFGSNQIIKRFESDFGKFHKYQFYVGEPEIDTATLVSLNSETLSLENMVEVYPNPNIGIFSIELSLQKKSTVNIDVFNSVGSVIISDIHNTVKDDQFTYDITSLSKGLYFIRIQSDGKTLVKKMIKD